MLRAIASESEIDDALFGVEQIGELLRQRIGVVDADAEGDRIAEEGDSRLRFGRYGPPQKI
jgi:hypothetical protein